MKHTTKFYTWVVSCLLAGVITCSTCWGADTKIVYVQVDRIIQGFVNQESNKKLEQEFSTRAQEVKKLQNQARDLQQSLEKEASDNDRKKKERDLSSIQIELQRKQRELSEDVNIRRNEEMTKLIDQINKVIQTMAETEGYDLVIHGGVAYASKKIDITDKVAGLLNRKK